MPKNTVKTFALIWLALVLLTGCTAQPEQAVSPSEAVSEIRVPAEAAAPTDGWEIAYGDFTAYVSHDVTADSGQPVIAIEKNGKKCALVKHMELTPGKLYRLSANIMLSSDYDLRFLTKNDAPYNIDFGAAICLSNGGGSRLWSFPSQLYDTRGVAERGRFMPQSFFFIPDECDVDIVLLCGAGDRGTAYFSDIRLEEAEFFTSTAWDILTVICREIDAEILDYSSRATDIHTGQYYYNNYSSSDINYLMGEIEGFGGLLEEVSGGRITVGKHTIVMTEYPLTEVYTVDGVDIFAYLDEVLADPAVSGLFENGDYDHLQMILPITENSIGGWEVDRSFWVNGLYKKRCGEVQIFAYPDLRDRSWFRNIMIHEICHSLEANHTPPVYDDWATYIPPLHRSGDYGYTPYAKGHDRQWYIDFMRNTIPGHPEAGLVDENFEVRKITEMSLYWQEDFSQGFAAGFSPYYQRPQQQPPYLPRWQPVPLSLHP